MTGWRALDGALISGIYLDVKRLYLDVKMISNVTQNCPTLEGQDQMVEGRPPSKGSALGRITQRKAS